jgi:hypothetical protein
MLPCNGSAVSLTQQDNSKRFEILRVYASVKSTINNPKRFKIFRRRGGSRCKWWNFSAKINGYGYTLQAKGSCSLGWCNPSSPERVALNRVHPIERNRSIPGLCWSWIAFNLNQIEGNPL